MGLTKVHLRGSNAQSFQKIPKNENQKIADSDEILFQGCSLIAGLRLKLQVRCIVKNKTKKLYKYSKNILYIEPRCMQQSGH